jgi:hypothetical protein
VVLARSTPALLGSYLFPIGWGLLCLVAIGLSLRVLAPSPWALPLALIPIWLAWISYPFFSEAISGLIANVRYRGIILTMDGDVLTGHRPFNGALVHMRLRELTSVNYSRARGKLDNFSIRAEGQFYRFGFGAREVDADVKALAEYIAARTELKPAPKQIYGFGPRQSQVYEWTTSDRVAEIEAEQAARRETRQRRKAKRAAAERRTA